MFRSGTRQSFFCRLLQVLVIIGCGVPLSLARPDTAQAQSPELVKNIETVFSAGQLSGDIGAFGNSVFFSFEDPAVGFELWKSDGTAAGTTLFADLEPGTKSSRPKDFTVVKRPAGDLLYFTATTDSFGTELWRTDGTPSGTFVIDVNPGVEDSQPRFLTPFGDKLLFAATLAGEGQEVFITDGTQAGTQRISSNAPGSDDAFVDFGGSPEGFAVANPDLPTRKAFFLGFDAFDIQFFATQGTAASTTKVTNLSPFALNTFTASFVGSSLGIFFCAGLDLTTGLELYRLDPVTLNVTLAADVAPQNGASSFPQDMAIIGNRVVFTASTSALGREVYAHTVGTPGATLLGDLTAGAPSSFDSFSFTNRIGHIGDRAYFSPDGSQSFTFRTFVTDGTPSGTRLLLNNAGRFSNGSNALFVGVGGHHYFSAQSLSFGRELFRTDGTPESTALVTDLFPGVGSGVGFRGAAFANNRQFILGRSPTTVALFTNSGALADTTLLKILVTPSEGGSSPAFTLGTVNDKALFSAITAERGVEIFATDGAASGTTRLRDIFPGDLSSNPTLLASLPGRAVFIASDPNLGIEPWVTDGTVEGTKVLKEISPGPASSLDFFGNITNATLGNSTFLFAADDGVHGRELWKSDGTEGGTVLVKDIFPGTGNGLPVGGGGPEGAVLNDRLLFSAGSSGQNFELWSSDGTSSGTTLLVELLAGATGSSPGDFTLYKGKMFFFALTETLGSQLWVTDGTASGTSNVTAVNLPPTGIGLLGQGLRVSGDRLYFSAFQPSTGREPWVSDGSAAGTRGLGDLMPGAADSNASNFIFFNDRTFFTATAPVVGRELWTTDGTPAGTVLFQDINPGPTDSNASGFSIADGALYFHAQVAGSTLLFRSDGTALGTQPVVTSASRRSTFTTLFHRGQLFFPGFDAALGTELFRIVLDACPDDDQKKVVGACGCGVPDTDANANGIADCKAGDELKIRLSSIATALKKLRTPADGRVSSQQRATLAQIRGLLSEAQSAASSPFLISTLSGTSVATLTRRLSKAVRKALKIRAPDFPKAKRAALRTIGAISRDIRP